MKPAHQKVFALGLLVLAVITWQILTRPKPPAGWLQVAAPARVTPGETITIRVTLSEPMGSHLLTTDLHGWTRRNRPLRAISHSPSRPVGPPGHTMDFQLPIPVLPDLAAVRAIIYLSPSGGWHDQVRAATTDEIPVEALPDPAPTRELQPLPAHDQIPDPAIERLESNPLRLLIAGLWLVVALGLGRRLSQAQLVSAGVTRQPNRPHPGLLMGICLTAALAEIFQVEQSVGDAARQFTLQHGLYDERLVPQQIAVLFTVVGMAALSVVVLIRARNRRLVLGLLVYAAVAFAATLSLHEVDALLYATALGLPLEQLAKLLAVSLSLWGLWSPSAGITERP